MLYKAHATVVGYYVYCVLLIISISTGYQSVPLFSKALMIKGLWVVTLLALFMVNKSLLIFIDLLEDINENKFGVASLWKKSLAGVDTFPFGDHVANDFFLTF